MATRSFESLTPIACETISHCEAYSMSWCSIKLYCIIRQDKIWELPHKFLSLIQVFFFSSFSLNRKKNFWKGFFYSESSMQILSQSKNYSCYQYIIDFDSATDTSKPVTFFGRNIVSVLWKMKNFVTS